MTSKVTDSYINIPGSTQMNAKTTYSISIPTPDGWINEDKLLELFQFLDNHCHEFNGLLRTDWSYWQIIDNTLIIGSSINMCKMESRFVIGNYTVIAEKYSDNVYVLDNRKEKKQSKEVTELQEQIKLLNEKLSKLENQ